MTGMTYKTTTWAEVKADVYGGDSCDYHELYIEAWCEGDMDSERMDNFSFDSYRWPVGTKIKIEVPCCPNCHLDAEYQDENHKCPECGFDWKNWAEEQHS
jgi:hypothetical protein